MATDYRENDDVLEINYGGDDDRVPVLDPDVAPATIGVYDRPEGKARTGLSVATIIGILVLLAIAIFVLTALF